jgi:ABC-type multidrug transport system, ATPase component
MIQIDRLTKRYGATVALDDVPFEVRAGAVTGLLGPNGAGKSTLMRLIVALDRPTSGRATVQGRDYATLRQPLRVVGAHLGGRPMHPHRSARQHLLALARSNRIGVRRVDDVLELTGLAAVAGRRTGTFSLGMGQRLGLAVALLGDPAALILDEPVNGLDTDGVRWVRHLLRDLAREGRAVLISSHLLSELQLVADQVVVLGRGRVLADLPTAQLAGRARDEVVLVTSAGDAGHRLSRALPEAQIAADPVDAAGTVTIRVTGATEEEVGRAAFALRIPVLRLVREVADLESG